MIVEHDWDVELLADGEKVVNIVAQLVEKSVIQNDQ
jgi:hypothetical protein